MAARPTGGAARAKRAAGAAAADAAPWIERFARFGYAAKGAVYALVGGLALAAVFSSQGQTTGSSGALTSIADSSLGRAALIIIAFGLAGYTLWGVVRAVGNPEYDSGARRAYYGVAAAIYGLLAVEAARLGLGNGGGGSGGGASHWTATLMQQPFGQWLVGIGGLTIAVFGLQQLWNAWRVDLDDHLAMGSMRPRTRTWAVRTGRLGLAARGGVLTIIGAYTLVAAVQADPSESRGIGGVLQMLQGTSWLLAIVALGLIAYGLYNFVRARYRVINPG